MAVSARLQRLREAVEELRALLLPDPFDPTGQYPDPAKIQLSALAFRLMAHAEVEVFLEGIAKDTALAAWKDWQGAHRTTRTLVTLLAFSEITLQLPPDAVPAPGTNRTRPIEVDDYLQKALNVFLEAIKRNHGVKEENVLRLLVPIGVAQKDLDGTLLADLESFGAERGEAAHSSSATISKACDPESEFKRVVSIVSQLERLDTVVLSLLD